MACHLESGLLEHLRKGVAGTATTPEMASGIIKAMFYAGLSASGVAHTASVAGY